MPERLAPIVDYAEEHFTAKKKKSDVKVMILAQVFYGLHEQPEQKFCLC